MTDDTTERPVRYCHGCKQYDDHPRVHHISDANNPADDKLYHYDCLPDAVAADHKIGPKHPAVAATAKGKRGDDVRQAVMSSNLVEKGN